MEVLQEYPFRPGVQSRKARFSLFRANRLVNHYMWYDSANSDGGHDRQNNVKGPQASSGASKSETGGLSLVAQMDAFRAILGIRRNQ